MTEHLLKLRAKDDEDTNVISAVLQDAIVPVCDIAYQVDDSRFVMVAHRFCWCDEPVGTEQAEGGFERIRSAVTISGVKAVQTHGFDQSDRGQMLDLLAVLLSDNTLQLVFAGGGEVKLTLENWEIRLEDFGEPWPTKHKPQHG